MDERLNILITGASSGIGLSLAQNYLKKGHQVFALARSREKLEALQAQYPEQVTTLVCDLSDLDQVRAVKNQLLEKTAYLDLMILNAGVFANLDANHFLSSTFDKVDSVNWKGNHHCLEVFLPVMMNAKSHSRIPHLVGISSLATILPIPGSEAYGASKTAFEYLLKCLQVDLHSQGFKMTIVRPGFVDTPLSQGSASLPLIMPSDKAAGIIVKGVSAGKHLVEFPKTLVYLMKLIALLPFSLQKRILQKIIRK